MSDARCPCDCESPCVLNEDLDQSEQRIKNLKLPLSASAIVIFPAQRDGCICNKQHRRHWNETQDR